MSMNWLKSSLIPWFLEWRNNMREKWKKEERKGKNASNQTAALEPESTAAAAAAAAVQ